MDSYQIEKMWLGNKVPWSLTASECSLWTALSLTWTVTEGEGSGHVWGWGWGIREEGDSRGWGAEPEGVGHHTLKRTLEPGGDGRRKWLVQWRETKQTSEKWNSGLSAFYRAGREKIETKGSKLWAEWFQLEIKQKQAQLQQEPQGTLRSRTVEMSILRVDEFMTQALR